LAEEPRKPETSTMNEINNKIFRKDFQRRKNVHRNIRIPSARCLWSLAKKPGRAVCFKGNSLSDESTTLNVKLEMMSQRHLPFLDPQRFP
jgi:hypothetical protein